MISNTLNHRVWDSVWVVKEKGKPLFTQQFSKIYNSNKEDTCRT